MRAGLEPATGQAYEFRLEMLRESCAPASGGNIEPEQLAHIQARLECSVSPAFHNLKLSHPEAKSP